MQLVSTMLNCRQAEGVNKFGLKIVVEQLFESCKDILIYKAPGNELPVVVPHAIIEK